MELLNMKLLMTYFHTNMLIITAAMNMKEALLSYLDTDYSQVINISIN